MAVSISFTTVYILIQFITFLLIIISILLTFWTYLTYKKEEMQTNLFLRYKYVRKSTLAFYAAIALFIILNSLDDLGVKVPIVYQIIKDLVVLVLLIISLYYFRAKRF